MANDTLESIAEVVMGQSPPGKAVSATKVGLPLLNGPTEFGGSHPIPVQFTTDVRKQAFQGDLLFCVRGSTGRMNWADQEYAIGRGIAAIRHRESLDFQPYVRAVIEYCLNDLLAQATGSTFPNVSATQLKSISFPRLGTTTQRAIAHILGTLDDKIELNWRMNATLEEMAQALFKSWFVDFDPVHAKQQGLAPEGMDEATAALFPDSFEESELGLVPKGWRVDSIYSKSNVVYGAPFASSKFNSDRIGIPLIRIRDLKNESPGIFTNEVHPKGYMVQPGDVVVGMDGEFRAYLWGGQPSWLNQRLCVFIPKNNASAAYVRSSIIPLLSKVEESETATTVIHIGKNDIDRFRIIIPSTQILTAFGDCANPIYARIVEDKQTAATLATLRDTLLPKLISGELRVGDAQKFIAEVGT